MQRKSRIIIGLVLLIVGLFTFLMPHSGSTEYFFGALLILAGLTATVMGVGKREGRELAMEGGLQGNVKSLRMEGEVANFWLEVSGKTGEHIPVEAYAGEGTVQEGDRVWVKGSRGGDGILRARQLRNMGRGMGAAEGLPLKEEMKRNGKVEFTGTVMSFMPYTLGKDYKVKHTRYGPVPKIGVKIERYDKDGNPLTMTEAVFDGEDNVLSLTQGDHVWISGKWDKWGRVLVEDGRNIDTGANLKSKKRSYGWVKKGVGVIIVLIILYTLFMILKSL